MNWILTWVVSVWMATSCPDFIADPYTGEYSTTMCAVNHGRFVERKMKKRFRTEKEALEFINNAPEYIRRNMKLIMDTRPWKGE